MTMRTAFVLALLLLPTASAADADGQGTDLDFLPPAVAGPRLSVPDADWLLLVVKPGQSLSGDLEFGAFLHEEFQEIGAVVHGEPLGVDQAVDSPAVRTATEGRSLAAKLQSAGVGSIYVEGRGLHWSVDGAAGSIDWRVAGRCALQFDSISNSERAGRFDEICPTGNLLVQAAASDGALTVSVMAEEVSVVEVHDWTFSCTEDPDGLCPTGPGRDVQAEHLGMATVQRRSLTFHRFTGQGSISLAGQAFVAFAGGDRLDVAVDGSARFPIASGSPCPGCEGPDHETLSVSGTFVLEEMVATGEGRLQGRLFGTLTSARIDERRIDAAAFLESPMAVATAAAAGFFVLAKFLLPLFTRMTREQTLEHPKRRAIFDYIRDHPGANFREVARSTSIAAGTVRHHLNVLERADLLVEYRHGATVRIFEKSARFDSTWADVVLLREPALGELHAWLRENPGSPQKAVLEGMEPLGWSRSTTQHRLGRLVDGGLASIRLQGRLKMYSATRTAPNIGTGQGSPSSVSVGQASGAAPVA